MAIDQNLTSSIAPLNSVLVVKPPPYIFPPIILGALFCPVALLVIDALSSTPFIYILTTPFCLVTATCVQVFRGILVWESNPPIQLVPFPKLACNLLADVIANAEIKSFVKISECATEEPFQYTQASMVKSAKFSIISPTFT